MSNQISYVRIQQYAVFGGVIVGIYLQELMIAKDGCVCSMLYALMYIWLLAASLISDLTSQ